MQGNGLYLTLAFDYFVGDGVVMSEGVTGGW